MSQVCVGVCGHARARWCDCVFVRQRERGRERERERERRCYCMIFHQLSANWFDPVSSSSSFFFFFFFFAALTTSKNITNSNAKTEPVTNTVLNSLSGHINKDNISCENRSTTPQSVK